MHLLRKVLVNLVVLAVLLVVLYCYQTSSNVSRWIVGQGENRNVEKSTNDEFISTTLKETNNLFVNITSTTITFPIPTITNTYQNKLFYNVWCIFTKVGTNSPMRKKFHVFTESLLALATVDIAFHVITDDDSHTIADTIVQNVMSTTNKTMKVQYYNVHELAQQLEDIVSVMSPHFSSKPGTYYSDALFFLSLGLHRIAPPDQKLAAMFDADTKFCKDVKELFKEFDNFGEEALFGLAPELSPVYRHVLYLYRSRHPKTMFGESPRVGGFPGFNSGMILFHLERLRKSSLYEKIVTKDSVDAMTNKYHFKGHLGDQDFYTVLGMERPELIYNIDCGWNRQLCTWWRDRGYSDVFNNYSLCNSETKLWHGNCNTPIPDH
ncbi:PREDICTED: xyloside xylosyltransferase 1 [Polistes canadensis]|uniref:xyloside xylosyltransferase 1 n=1 Tax=Polistes canadensis TaxID=91411 RepID=UPI000718D59C|nr:PREDICTED: xyloside xylosyltransferase 1 [Polistes canadensis]